MANKTRPRGKKVQAENSDAIKVPAELVDLIHTAASIAGAYMEMDGKIQAARRVLGAAVSSAGGSVTLKKDLIERDWALKVVDNGDAFLIESAPAKQVKKKRSG